MKPEIVAPPAGDRGGAKSSGIAAKLSLLYYRECWPRKLQAVHSAMQLFSLLDRSQSAGASAALQNWKCCSLTLHALLTDAASSRLSRGQRSGGQLSSSEPADPPTADASPFCASFSTSLSCRHMQDIICAGPAQNQQQSKPDQRRHSTPL